ALAGPRVAARARAGSARRAVFQRRQRFNRRHGSFAGTTAQCRHHHLRGDPPARDPGAHRRRIRDPACRRDYRTHNRCRSGPMKTLRATVAHLGKDFRLEWRSKDAVNAMLFFGLLVVTIFSVSFDPNAEEARRIAGGILWVAFLFAATTALNQTWAR